MKHINRLWTKKARLLVMRGRNLPGNAPKELRARFKSLKGQKGTEGELGWENLTLKKIFRVMKKCERNPKETQKMSRAIYVQAQRISDI